MPSSPTLLDLIHGDPYRELMHLTFNSIARIQWRTQSQFNDVLDAVMDCQAAMDDESDFYKKRPQDGQFGMRRASEARFRCTIRRLCIVLAGGHPGPLKEDFAEIRKPGTFPDGCLNCGSSADQFCDRKCRDEFAADLWRGFNTEKNSEV